MSYELNYKQLKKFNPYILITQFNLRKVLRAPNYLNIFIIIFIISVIDKMHKNISRIILEVSLNVN